MGSLNANAAGSPNAGLARPWIAPAARAARGALAGWWRRRQERRLLEFDERLLRDIGAPENLIEAARAHRSGQRNAQAIARRLEFLR